MRRGSMLLRRCWSPSRCRQLCAGRAGAAGEEDAAPSPSQALSYQRLPERSRHRSQPDAPVVSSELQPPASHRSFPGNSPGEEEEGGLSLFFPPGHPRITWSKGKLPST